MNEITFYTLTCTHTHTHLIIFIGVFVSGGRDGCVLIWDTRCSGKGSTHKPVNGIYSAHERNKEGLIKKGGRSVDPVSSSTRASVTAVLFHGDHKIASCGAGDG